ncbi:MAG: AAA family ATPase [Kiritimatiellae bacterium]|nr:AAA family ATPase [Kiritimatiellia bacterium]
MYLSFFQLQEFPFSITPDPKYLYFAASHREAFDHLLFGITHRKGFIELTGEVGCGKSTICRAVLAELGGQTKSALILNPCLNGLQLLRAILADFGLVSPRQDRFTQLQTLNAFLLEQAQAGVNVALIIDEAQDLPPRTLEEVRLLSNLETAQHKLIQIVLSGQPELKSRLEAPSFRQLRQRITVRYHIPPLEHGEVAAYIAHRLRTAGAPDDVLFEDEAAEAVARYARGVPRLINALCDYALLAAFVQETRRVTAACVARGVQQLEGQPA